MDDIYIRKYWAENNLMIYMHFQEGKAVAQIEISNKNKVFLSSEDPLKGESMLYDQSFEELELEENDFISKNEFLKIWGNK